MDQFQSLRGRNMKLEFDTKREEEIFREILKDADICTVEGEILTEACTLVQKMEDYYKKPDAEKRDESKTTRISIHEDFLKLEIYEWNVFTIKLFMLY